MPPVLTFRGPFGVFWILPSVTATFRGASSEDAASKL